MKVYTVRTYVGGDQRFHQIKADNVVFEDGMMKFISNQLNHTERLVAAFPKKKTVIEEVKK